MAGSSRIAVLGSLHDLAEAYLPDIPRPIKRMGTGILKEAEALIMQAACSRFGLPSEEPAEVKAADDAFLAAEVKSLMNPTLCGAKWEFIAQPTPITIVPLDPRAAKKLFLGTFALLVAR